MLYTGIDRPTNVLSLPSCSTSNGATQGLLPAKTRQQVLKKTSLKSTKSAAHLPCLSPSCVCFLTLLICCTFYRIRPMAEPSPLSSDLDALAEQLAFILVTKRRLANGRLSPTLSHITLTRPYPPSFKRCHYRKSVNTCRNVYVSMPTCVRVVFFTL